MVILHHEAAGIGANWNHCLRHATGTYVKFLFQDDLITPDCIERMVKMAVQDPDVGLVYCRRHIIHDPGNPAHTAWVRRFGAVHLSWGRLAVSEGIMDGKAYLRDPNLLMHPRNKIGEPTAVLLHRRVFDREGLFDERLKQMLDYFHWYKVMRHFKVAFVDAELASFRLHDDQATSRNNRAASLPEYAMLPGLYLRHFFWQVAPTVRWALLKQGTKAGRLLVRTGLIQ
jgi:glycosyltransferase involved in cell wall biosynthesis